MPLYKQIWFGSDAALQIWLLEEDVPSLFAKAALGEDEMPKYLKITHPKRKMEFLASRILLHNVFPESQILYDDMGAPYICSVDAKVSVSHTDGIVCLLHSNKNCGVDVEVINSRALRLANRFTSELERGLIDEEFPERSATLIWSVKETLFKMLRKEGIDFAKQLHVQQIDGEKQKTILTRVHADNIEFEQVVYYEFMGKYVLTWTFDDK